MSMTEEEKKAAQEAEAKAKADAEQAEFEASLESLSDEEKTQKITEKEAEKEAKSDTGLEEALKSERLRREKAENALDETRRKSKEAYEKRKKEREEQGLDEEDDKPLTREEMRIMLDEEREIAHKETQEARAQELAKGIAESPLEAELTLEIWKSRKLAGTLNEQMKEAHAIATYQRREAQNRELKRALMGKEGETNDNLNTQRKPAPGKEPYINPADKIVLAGYVWDEVKKAYKKTIAEGKKILYVSRDLKKRWIENA